MTTGGRVAIVEVVLGELSDPGWGALIDVNMLAISPGQERFLEEYDALVAEAGLRCRGFYLTQKSRSRPPALYTTPSGGGPTTSKYSLPVDRPPWPSVDGLTPCGVATAARTW
jgi:hypothetical protein